MFIETKGNHLKNPDSNYKSKVFEYLNKHTKHNANEFKLIANHKEVAFNLVYEDGWQEDLLKIAL